MFRRSTKTAGFAVPAQEPARSGHLLPALIAVSLSVSIVIVLTAVTISGARAMQLF